MSFFNYPRRGHRSERTVRNMADNARTAHKGGVPRTSRYVSPLNARCGSTASHALWITDGCCTMRYISTIAVNVRLIWYLNFNEKVLSLDFDSQNRAKGCSIRRCTMYNVHVCKVAKSLSDFSATVIMTIHRSR